MSQNIPPPQGFEPYPEVPVPVPHDPNMLSRPAPRPVDAGDRILAVVEILFTCGILTNTAALAFMQALFGVDQDSLVKNPQFLFYYLMADTVFLFATIYFFLRLRQRSFGDLGFRSRALAFNLALGLLILPGLIILAVLGSFVFQIFFPDYAMTKNLMLEVIQTPKDLAFFMISGILAGGVREEVQRAFILTRFKKYLFGAWPGLMLWSIFFGYMHYTLEGLQGAVITGLLGLCFGLLFLQRKSIYGPIVGHAAFNTVQLISFWLTARSSS